MTGATAEDTATVTGDGGTPTGTVTYTLYDNATCSSPAAETETVTMSGGDVPASSVTPALEAGSYSYQAMYSGDSNYAPGTGVLRAVHGAEGVAGDLVYVESA